MGGEAAGGTPARASADALRAAGEAVLRANWREGMRRDGVPYAFTCPSTPRYRHMWHWDSCFHAIAWRLIDPARARAELRTVLRSGRPDGFLPHTVFWDAPAGWRRAPLYATRGLLGDRHTETIGPPLLAFAWELVAEASTDEPGFRQEALRGLGAHLDWLSHERDPDGDGLLTIVVPDESGLDDSPKYEPVFGRLTHDRAGYALLMERGRRARWDSHALIARHDHHVEDVWVNVAYALSLHAMGRLSGESSWAVRARRVEHALLERCLDPRTGLFLDLAGAGERPVPVSTWSALSPLALPGLPEAVRRRLVEEHLLDDRRYLAPFGIPSVSMQEPSFRPRWDRFRTWRGPSWVNTAWLLAPAMRELGYERAADRVGATLAAAALREGFREYYDPLTGQGLGARGFGWSTLLLEMAPAADAGYRRAIVRNHERRWR
jgi:glycogen debranching enzyme